MLFDDCAEANFCLKGPSVGLKSRHLSVRDMTAFMCTGYQTKLDLERVLWFNDDLFVAVYEI